MQHDRFAKGTLPDALAPVRWRARGSIVMSKALIVERDGVLAGIQGGIGSKGQIVDDVFIAAVKPSIHDGYPLVLLGQLHSPLAGNLRRFAARRLMLRTVAYLRRHEIAVAAFACCPHELRDECSCRKPKTGLFDVCSQRFHVSLGRSVYIGATITDLEMGARAGITTEIVIPTSAQTYQDAFARARSRLNALL